MFPAQFHQFSGPGRTGAKTYPPPVSSFGDKIPSSLIRFIQDKAIRRELQAIAHHVQYVDDKLPGQLDSATQNSIAQSSGSIPQEVIDALDGIGPGVLLKLAHIAEVNPKAFYGPPNPVFDDQGRMVRYEWCGMNIADAKTLTQQAPILMQDCALPANGKMRVNQEPFDMRAQSGALSSTHYPKRDDNGVGFHRSEQAQHEPTWYHRVANPGPYASNQDQFPTPRQVQVAGQNLKRNRKGGIDPEALSLALSQTSRRLHSQQEQGLMNENRDVYAAIGARKNYGYNA